MFTLAAQEFGGRLHHGGWTHPWLGLVIWLIFVAAIGAAAWTLLRSRHWTRIAASPAGGVDSSDNAMEILRARFAHGEIGADEFVARAAHLEGRGAPTPPTTEEPPSPPIT